VTTGDRATSVVTDCPIITATNEASAHGKDILKGISAVRAHLKHAAIEPNIGVCGCFKVEVVPECQLSAAALEKREKE
jgi:hypothetical protein